MLSEITVSTMSWFDNLVLTIFLIILVISIVASLCSGDEAKPKTKKTYMPPKTRRTYTFDDDYPDYTDYDPSWDDAWFDKTGQDPWFDDNRK